MAERKLGLRDNKGKTLDRYTFIIAEKDIAYFYSFSENPQDAMGIDNYCGSSEDGMEDGPHLGETTHFMDIPVAVRDAIFNRYNENREKIIQEMRAKILKFENKPKLTKSETKCHQDLVDALMELLSA